MIDKNPDVVMEKGDPIKLHLYDRAGERHEVFVLNGAPVWNAFDRRFELSAMTTEEWHRRHAVREEAKAESLMFGPERSPVNQTPEQPLKEIAKDRVAEYRQTKEMEYLRLCVQGIENRMTKFESEERSAAQILTMLDEFGNLLQRIERDKQTLKNEIDILKARQEKLSFEYDKLARAHDHLNAQVNAPEPRTTKRKRK